MLSTIIYLYTYTELFSVSSDGRISTDKEIDKEMIDSDITFVITATDNGGLADTVSVAITNKKEFLSYYRFVL